MEYRKINITELKPYVDMAIEDDDELLNYYDRGEFVDTVEAAAENICKKIKILYPEATLIGVENDDRKIGYFVYDGPLLISFSINQYYRNEKGLKQFYDLIKQEIGNNFNVILYTYNTRAINWLKKCGLIEVMKEVTILSTI
jgi:hypothetical protein